MWCWLHNGRGITRFLPRGRNFVRWTSNMWRCFHQITSSLQQNYLYFQLHSIYINKPHQYIFQHFVTAVTCQRPTSLPPTITYKPRKVTYAYGETITFSCEDGYNIIGTTVSECLISGEFSRTKVSCESKWLYFSLPSILKCIWGLV